MIHLSPELFWSACHKVVAECPDEYAKTYAAAGLRMYQMDLIKDQVPYILGNMRNWRGDTAKAVRGILKLYMGGRS